MAIIPSFFGYNFTFWLIISFTRFLWEHVLVVLFGRKNAAKNSSAAVSNTIKTKDLAVIMSAHNEATSIAKTLQALKKNVPARQIYIASDGSTDNTAAIARAAGCHVKELSPNRGKAKTLTYLLEHHRLLKKYAAILIMDAEVIVSDTYLEKILPYFNDPKVVAFVSHSVSHWINHKYPRWSMLFTAYRIRLWLTLYYGLRYGQTWKYTSVTPIIPGGSSVYRSSALEQIEIDTPGLIIEDFHMTFQVHHKKLGRIASHPSAHIYDQEPYSLRDYTRQVFRWFLGFWQTFFYHGYWPSFFWFATFFFLIEMVAYSVIILTIPFLILFMAFTPFDSFAIIYVSFAPLGLDHQPVTITGLLIMLFVMDYALTILTSFLVGRPALLFYGLGFFLLRYIDTVIFLWTLPLSLLTKGYTGTWRSPARKAV